MEKITYLDPALSPRERIEGQIEYVSRLFAPFFFGDGRVPEIEIVDFDDRNFPRAVAFVRLKEVASPLLRIGDPLPIDKKQLKEAEGDVVVISLLALRKMHDVPLRSHDTSPQNFAVQDVILRTAREMVLMFERAAKL